MGTLASYILSIMLVGGLYFSLPKYSCAGWLDNAREKASELKDKAAQKAREVADRLNERVRKLKDDTKRKADDAARQLRRDVERKKREWEVEEKAERAKAYLDEQAKKGAKAIGGEMYRSKRSLDKAKEAWGDPKTPEQRRAALRRAKDAFMKEHKITNEEHFEMLFDKHVDENWAKASKENRRVMKAIVRENEKMKEKLPQPKLHKERPRKDDTERDNTRQADRVLKKFAGGIEAVCSWCGRIISDAYHYVIRFFSYKGYVGYTVKKGDSLSGIAKDRTGNWRNWQEIMKYNKKYNSEGFDEHLDIGEKVYIPRNMLKK